MINELNSAFDLGLCTDPVLARSSDAILSARREIGFKKLIAVIGGSYASRLAQQLLAREAQVVELTQPGWKVSNRAV